MKSRVFPIVTLVAGMLAWSVLNRCGPARGAPPALATKPVGGEVTIRGNVLSNIHTGEKRRSVFLLAYDGTPEIKAEFERIMAEHYPDAGLDAESAQRVQDLFMTRLRYEVDGPLVEEMWKEARWTVRGVKAVTGVISGRDGRKWITASKWEAATLDSNSGSQYGSPPLPVQSKHPNAWGFYDMHSGWWERVSDAPVIDHQDTLDPDYTPP